MKPGAAAILLAGLLAVPAMAAETATPVEIWFSGDDGLTQKLVDALRQAVGKDAHFRLAPSATDGALKIFIPTHVRWQPAADGLDVTASAEFSRNGMSLGQIEVTCTDKTIAFCADGIVAAAQRALD